MKPDNRSFTEGLKPQIAPSILAADFYSLKPQIESVKAYGARVLHVDVMDGSFVPNISLGVPVVAALKRSAGMILDVHLMIEDPKRYIKAFAEAGADWLTVHLEAVPMGGLAGLLKDIRKLGTGAGLSIKPSTPVSALEPFVELCGMILIMTVPPGFGGQSYDINGNERIAEARELIDRHNPGCVLSIDGGVDKNTISGAYRAGARLFVAGSSVFAAPDPGAAMRELLESIEVS